MIIFPGLLVFLAVFVLVCIVVVWLRFGRYGAPIHTLEVACGLAAIMTFLTGFSIGLSLVPSTLFALLASALALGARRAELG